MAEHTGQREITSVSIITDLADTDYVIVSDGIDVKKILKKDLIKELGTANKVTFTPTGTISSTDVQSAIAELDTEKASISSLATVATSGSYNDLSNKPTIPTLETFSGTTSLQYSSISVYRYGHVVVIEGNAYATYTADTPILIGDVRNVTTASRDINYPVVTYNDSNTTLMDVCAEVSLTDGYLYATAKTSGTFNIKYSLTLIV